MLNFRYHLVSLIAVFAALAVGVVLGAGPLQTRISSSLAKSEASTGVDANALAEAQRAASADAAGLRSIAEARLSGSLSGLKIATLALPGASKDDVDSVTEGLKAAGAEVVGAVSLTSNWESSGMAKYRETLSTPLATHLASLPSNASSDAVIAFGVVATLASTGSETDLVREILTDESTPILALDSDPKGAAQAIVAVGARDSARSTDAAQSTGGASPEAWSGLARAVAGAPKSGVLVGDAHDATSMIASLRASGAQVTTIDSPGTALSVVSAVAALRDAAAQARSFGVGQGAEKVMPTLP